MAVDAVDSENIDRRRVQSIKKRLRHGQEVTAEERAYLEHVKQIRLEQARARRGKGQASTERRQQDPRVAERRGQVQRGAHTGLAPLTETEDGLYGGGRNEPSPALLDRARQATARIVPRDRDGRPAGDGRVVLLAIGGTGALDAYNGLRFRMREQRATASELTLLSGAHHDWDLADWGTYDLPGPWRWVDESLARLELNAAQVQAAWVMPALKEANRFGGADGYRAVLVEEIETLARKLPQHFPNLAVIYLSSPVYGGWFERGSRPETPEPYAHASGLAVRDAILRQASGDAEGASAPLLLWGPYLWADGDRARADGLRWERADFRADGANFSGRGQQKAGALLAEFFLRPPAASWFAARPGAAP